jgi:phasin family protein
MNQQIISQITEQFAKVSIPASQFQGVLVDHIEKVTQFQFEAAKGYVELGLGQLRAAAAIKDVKDLQGYVAGQNKAAEAFAAKVQADAQTLLELSKAFGGEVQKVVNTGAAAKPARKAA